MKTLFSLTLFTVSLILLSISDSNAIPAFARKYSMTCKTCHAPFPKLKPYGDEFAGNGFVLADKDAPRYFMDTGDDELSLLRDLPLAFRLEGYVTYNQSKNRIADINAPVVFKLLSGGAITKGISYYIYYILERGEVGKIEDAFLYFKDLLNTRINFTIGQFQVSDPLFKRELRLTQEDYQIFKVQPPSSHANLTYDRGLIFDYTLPTNTDLIFEVVNGNGINEAIDDVFDNDKFKNFFGRISQDISDNVRAGAFGYFGRESQNYFSPASNEIFSTTNQIKMYGADLTLTLGPVELNAFYQLRDDNSSLIDSIPTGIKTKGGFAELIFLPNGDDSKWYGAGLLNWIESDLEMLRYKSLALHFGYLLRRNIRLTAEYKLDIKNNYNTFSFGVITAF